MMRTWLMTAALSISLYLICVSAQLTGPVGPLTTREQKRSKICNVLDFGAEANKTSNISPALVAAFTACKNGGTVYIPPGEYGMSKYVSLNDGKAWAIQLDGIIYRTGLASGNMIAIRNANDFELYSSTSRGAIQGNGYETRLTMVAVDPQNDPNIVRLFGCKNFSVHDITLVDAPQFHLFLDGCTNGEVYNIMVHGANEGGVDAIDVIGTNIWVHDIAVTNKDECVTIKSPAHNILVENLYCNWSGGCAIGSLSTGTSISNVHYRNVYTWNSNQMFMIKSSGGSGSVTNCTFENFIGHSNAYSLDLNAHWASQKVGAGAGVQYTNLTFKTWVGTCADGGNRAPINIICPDTIPCRGIDIKDFNIWTDVGNEELYRCVNAFGTGGCFGADGVGSNMTVTIPPTGYLSAPTMPSDVRTPIPLTSSIPIPSIPTSFFPGQTPLSKLLGATVRASMTTNTSIALTTPKPVRLRALP